MILTRHLLRTDIRTGWVPGERFEQALLVDSVVELP